ncbi:hypothetical protein TVAG_159740 [Trichomonas vaginalis G3]|uniref:Uncharacterized protein n=1 Tax=Trichomonas vaginalis (strain ATCC PRA-98 / G3) TaxID=412133 RepID=A2DUR6_TRIV3|nr:armadillo (ARM) repeat-containing protein family [Trichomonas vaginalis G3]EAY15801.1 hypothetical protein TVAG_159740 [Trichomonas vaginalis G3]KAI5525028.1 armadillo (ARM) repeat-containing protein family [Trichomonas vaginalis G3]|eukprot:XP_001328024.1 hypothetical protein [Trichomonas vaginalis G3]
MIYECKFTTSIVKLDPKLSIQIILSKFFSSCQFIKEWSDDLNILIFQVLKTAISAFSNIRFANKDDLESINQKIIDVCSNTLNDTISDVQTAKYTIRVSATEYMCELLRYNHQAVMIAVQHCNELFDLMLDVISNENTDLAVSVLRAIRKILASCDYERDLSKIKSILSSEIGEKMDELIDAFQEQDQVIEQVNLLKEDIDQYLEFLEIDGIELES